MKQKFKREVSATSPEKLVEELQKVEHVLTEQNIRYTRGEYRCTVYFEHDVDILKEDK